MKQHPNNIMIDKPSAVDSGLRKCRNCGKLFHPAKSYFICCSWQCTQDHQQKMEQLDELEQAEYKGHPF